MTITVEDQENEENIDENLEVEEREENAEAESTEPAIESEEENGEDEELVVLIGDAPPPEEESTSKAPEWVRELRKSHREAQRRNRELEEEVQRLKAPTSAQVVLGEKPTLENFEYDTEKYETALEDWYGRKRKIEEKSAQEAAAKQSQKDAWQEKLNAYEAEKKKLNFKHFEDAEDAVFSAFDETQQGIIVQGSDNPALVFYALGNNAAKLKELADIKDPVKFSFAAAKLETQLKTHSRKAPPPERTVGGTAPKGGDTLERLREDAAKTGDYSKVHQYKKQQRLKAKT